MVRRIFQFTVLLASFAIAIGAHTSLCNAATVFGIDVHHHKSDPHSHCAAEHDCHEKTTDRAPCSEECDSDLTDANVPKPTVFFFSAGETSLPLWQELRDYTDTSREPVRLLLEPPTENQPPPVLCPPVTGCFLI